MYINSTQREKVNAILTVPEINQTLESYIVMATKSGKIKTMEISKFKNIRKSGLHSFKLKNDDEIISVALALMLNVFFWTSSISGFFSVFCFSCFLHEVIKKEHARKVIIALFIIICFV